MTDAERILALPRLPEEIPDFTQHLRQHGGKMVFRDAQNQMLLNALLGKGLVALAAVGSGKTLVCFQLPRILKASRPLLVIPAQMRPQARADFREYGQHFTMPRPSRVRMTTGLMMRTYEEISHPHNRGLLGKIKPDLIICDEAHKIRHLSSTRTKRIAGYLRDNPGCMFCALSGTLANTSIMDYAHLLRWALKEKSPLPYDTDILRSWSRVVDTKSTDPEDLAAFQPVVDITGKHGQEGFRALFNTIPGLMATEVGGVEASLYLHARRPEMPETVLDIMAEVRRTWRTPGGEEIDSPFRLGNILRQITFGFYYYWDWKGEPDKEWLESRAAWAKAVRRVLAAHIDGMDSPAMIYNAVKRAVVSKKGRLPRFLVEAWLSWRVQRKKRWNGQPTPPTKIAWIHDYLVDDVLAWAKQQKDPPIIWYEHKAVAIRLYQKAKIPVLGGGQRAARLLSKTTKPSLAALSIPAHYQGKNLQVWGNQIILGAVSDPNIYEQLLGRTHRKGQQRPEVHATYYKHGLFSNSLLVARAGAKNIETTTPNPQRLCYATYTDLEDVQFNVKAAKEAELGENRELPPEARK